MRYRIGTDPAAAPAYPDTAVFAAAALFGLVLGIAFVIAGYRGRQLWLAVWGGGLAVVSVVYLAVMGAGLA